MNSTFIGRQLTPRHATLYVTAALLLTILSPFGTDLSLTVKFRFLYWFGVILGGTAIALVVSNLFARHVRTGKGLRHAFVISMQVLTASVPITLLVAGMEMWLRKPLGWGELPQLFGYVVTITAAITAVSMLLERYTALKKQVGDDWKDNESQSQPESMLALTPFHHRLDPLLRRSEILMLKAEDHYLRVSTSNGDALIRCTMEAGVNELGNTDGRRVHRSFWVARSAVSRIQRHGNAYRLVMKDGKSVPMSRHRYRKLSRCEWFPV